MITCTVCDKPIGQCECPGRDEELRAIAYDPQSNVAFKWCRKCDKHYSRCRCVPPEFYVIHQGKEIKNQFTNIEGRQVEADLDKR